MSDATQDAAINAMDRIVGLLLTDYDVADGTLTVFFGHDRRLVIVPDPTMHVRVEVDQEG